MAPGYKSASIIALLVGLLIAAVAAPVRADDVRVNQIMLDVQDLQRTVRDQARRIDELERSLAQARFSLGAGPASRGQPLKPPGEEWLQSRNWERVRTGMTAQDVIAVLGAPASMRESDDGRKTLLYAMQLGASGYLAGSVVIANDRVVEVTRPLLR
jgi:hypothetical protein